MAINVSNIKEWWTIKFYKEEWFFKDFDEFAPIFEFLIDGFIPFNVTPRSGGFSIFMGDANLKNFDFDNVKTALTKCLDYKHRFGDKTRLGGEVREDDDKEDF